MNVPDHTAPPYTADVARENRELHTLREVDRNARIVADPNNGFTSVERAIARWILTGGGAA